MAWQWRFLALSIVASGCGWSWGEAETCPAPPEATRRLAIDAHAALDPLDEAADAWWRMRAARHDAFRSLFAPLPAPEPTLADELPMHFVGAGTYVLEASWGRATWRVRRTVAGRHEYPAADLFDPDSYLRGASTTVDWAAGTVTIDYAAHGPLVAWLGLGDAPPQPIVLALDELPEASPIDALVMELAIAVDGELDGVHARYDARVPFSAADEVGPLALELTDDELEISREGEPLDVASWQVLTDGHLYTDRVQGGFEVLAEVEGETVFLNAGAQEHEALGDARCVD